MSKASLKSDHGLSFREHEDKLRTAWKAVNASLHGDIKKFVLKEIEIRQEQVKQNSFKAFKSWNERHFKW